jgi:hypothetical protein
MGDGVILWPKTVILSFLKREHKRTFSIPWTIRSKAFMRCVPARTLLGVPDCFRSFHDRFMTVSWPFQDQKRSETVRNVGKFRNGQEGWMVRNVERLETFAKSRSRYVHVHASKTEESMKHFTVPFWLL